MSSNTWEENSVDMLCKCSALSIESSESDFFHKLTFDSTNRYVAFSVVSLAYHNAIVSR